MRSQGDFVRLQRRSNDLTNARALRQSLSNYGDCGRCMYVCIYIYIHIYIYIYTHTHRLKAKHKAMKLW